MPETRRRVIVEASAASWNEILSVNLMGYVFCAKAAVPLMRRYSMPIVDATLVGRTRKLRRFANV